MSKSLRGRAEAGEDPPQEEDGTRATIAAELGVVSPLTRDSSGETSQSLGDRQREQKIQKLPRTSPRTSRHPADVILSLASTAGREEEESTETISRAMKTPTPGSTERRLSALLSPATTAGQKEPYLTERADPEEEKSLALIEGAPTRNSNTGNLSPGELASKLLERPAGAVHKHRRR